MRYSRPKRYCPLCKIESAMEKIADYTYRCYRCGYKINEREGQSAYHKQVLVAKPSVVSFMGESKVIIKDKEELTRSESLARMNRSITHERYDRDSMLNPRKKVQPGKVIGSDLWMSANYASMDTDAVTDKQRAEFDKRLGTKRYLR
jgi:transposase-like protein